MLSRVVVPLIVNSLPFDESSKLRLITVDDVSGMVTLRTTQPRVMNIIDGYGYAIINRLSGIVDKPGVPYIVMYPIFDKLYVSKKFIVPIASMVNIYIYTGERNVLL